MLRLTSLFVLFSLLGCSSSEQQLGVANDGASIDAPGDESSDDAHADDTTSDGPSEDAGGDATADTTDDATSDASAPSTLFGAAYSPHTDARLTDLSSQWGGVQVTRTYDEGKGAGRFAALQPLDLKFGAASAFSFKYPPAEVIAGTHDADVSAFFDGIADGHLVYWTYWHEPDDEIYKDHTFTAADYRAAWAHLRKLADAARAKRPKLSVRATLIIMEYSMRPEIAASRPLTGPNGMYPGDDVIEVFGVDAYNDKSGVRDAANQFGKVIDFAQAHKKPWAIGEIGSCVITGDASARATYLKKAIQYWKSRSYMPEYVAYFDIDWSTCDYRIDGDASATKVWHDAVTLGAKAF